MSGGTKTETRVSRHVDPSHQPSACARQGLVLKSRAASVTVTRMAGVEFGRIQSWEEEGWECEGREQAEVWRFENPSNGLLFVFPGRPGDPGLPWPEGKKEGEGRRRRGPHPPVVTQVRPHHSAHRVQTWSCTHTFAHTLTQHEPHGACAVGWTGVHVSTWRRRWLRGSRALGKSVAQLDLSPRRVPSQT